MTGFHRGELGKVTVSGLSVNVKKSCLLVEIVLKSIVKGI